MSVVLVHQGPSLNQEKYEEIVRRLRPSSATSS